MWYGGTKEDARTAFQRGDSGEDPEEASEKEGLEKEDIPVPVCIL
jgi:hypothetical protein